MIPQTTDGMIKWAREEFDKGQSDIAVSKESIEGKSDTGLALPLAMKYLTSRGAVTAGEDGWTEAVVPGTDLVFNLCGEGVPQSRP